MRTLRHPLAAFVIACSVLGACGSDESPAAVAGADTTSAAPSDTAAAAATQLPATGDDVNCTSLKDNLANVTINWQVVIGLPNSATSEWPLIPLGSITKFGDQLASVAAALGGDADAAETLAFMSGANNIVDRGLGGDTTAQADLAAYMGTDIGANVSKQIPLALAYDKTGCK